MKYIKILLSLLLMLTLSGCGEAVEISVDNEESDEIYSVINDNDPSFKKSEYTKKSYIHLSELDDLGRTGEAMACLSKDTMPKDGEKRGSIGMIKPTGWHTSRYDTDLVDGGMLYNRCHQIAWCLSSLNAEKRNLMTGTRSFNVDGMLPFENMVADYIKETSHHVIYRSTPEFKDDELVARSLHLEAASVEDDEIRINVRIYNKQDGITIDYATGDNHLTNQTSNNQTGKVTYILNTSSHKFHKTDCKNLKEMKSKNKKSTTKSRSELIKEGYEPCGTCNP